MEGGAHPQVRLSADVDGAGQVRALSPQHLRERGEGEHVCAGDFEVITDPGQPFDLCQESVVLGVDRVGSASSNTE